MNIAIIPAAGVGKRMGGDLPKQFSLLAGKPILAWTLEKMQSLPQVDAIIVAGEAEHLDRIKSMAAEYGITKFQEVVEGGAYRQHSVWNALRAASPVADLILVHDAVRPFVTADEVQRVVDAAKHFGAAILAVRVKDTIKQSDEQEFIENTLDRESLWCAQTPQVFKREMLFKAFQNANNDHFLVNDESSILEYSGADVKIIEGSYANVKITTPEDFSFAEFLISKQ